MIFKRTIHRDDLVPCALCEDAPCTKACGMMDCAALIRAAWFDNEQGAARALPKHLPCVKCPAKCEKACVFPGQVQIRRTMKQLAAIREELDLKEAPDQENLRVNFAGFLLPNPFILDVPDASDTLEKCLRAFQAGYGGVILPFTAQKLKKDKGYISPRFGSIKMGGTVMGLIDIGLNGDEEVNPSGDAEQTGSEPAAAEAASLQGCLEFIPELKRSYPGNMVIASYIGQKGVEPGSFSAQAEKAGADALLLDFSYMVEPALKQVQYLRACLEAVRKKTEMPLILRFQVPDIIPKEFIEIAEEFNISALAPQLTSRGILSVNRHYYAPEPSVRGQSTIGRSSGLNMIPTALARQACLAKEVISEKFQFLSGSGNESWGDGLDFILLGATAVCVSDAVMRYGLRIIVDMKDGLSCYLAEKNFTNIEYLIGEALPNVRRPDELDKDAVMYPKISRTKCVGCGRCTQACNECATGAMTVGFDHVPMVIANRCTGCHLCIQVCPTGAINPARRS